MQKEAKAHRSSCLPQETKHPLNPTIYAIHKPHLSLAQTHEAATKSFPAASRSRRPSTSGSPSSAALSQLASTSAPLTMVLSTKTSSKDQLHPRSDPPTPPIYTSYPDWICTTILHIWGASYAAIPITNLWVLSLLAGTSMAAVTE